MAASVIGHAVLVVGRAADEVGVGLELGAAALVEEVDDALDLGDGFDADAVAGQQEQVVRGHAMTGLERGGMKSAVVLAACHFGGKGKGGSDEGRPEEQKEAVEGRDDAERRHQAAQHQKTVPPVMMAIEASTMATCSSAWP